MKTPHIISVKYADYLPDLHCSIDCFEQLILDVQRKHKIDLDYFSLNNNQIVDISNWMKNNYLGLFLSIRHFCKNGTKFCYFYHTYLDWNGEERTDYIVYSWENPPYNVILSSYL